MGILVVALDRVHHSASRIINEALQFRFRVRAGKPIQSFQSRAPGPFRDVGPERRDPDAAKQLRSVALVKATGQQFRG